MMQFGCFVQLEGLRGRHEGLVHISQVSCYLYHMVVNFCEVQIFVGFSYPQKLDYENINPRK